MDDELCGACCGSGEGMHDGTRCRTCGGSGGKRTAADCDERAEYYAELYRDDLGD
jgi:hypothetical protein